MATVELADHVVLCGLGKVAISVLRILHQQRIPVAVITREVPTEWARRVERWSAAVVLDDDRDEVALLEARIGAARAVIIATDDDVANLEAALDCLSLAPDVPIVLRLYDEELARRVRESLPIRAVLNAGQVAAGAFVAAALGRNVLSVGVSEQYSVDITEVAVDKHACEAAPNLQAFADTRGLIPLYLRREGQPVERPLDATEPLQAGDVLVAATLRSTASSREAPAAEPARRRPRRKPAVARALHAMWTQSGPAVRTTIALLAVLFVTAVPVYRYGLNLSWLDAVYFTVTVLTTVGFGDIVLIHASPALKVFGIITMLGGAVSLVTVLGVVASYLVTIRLEEAITGPHVSLEGHTIVVGIGNIGHRVVRQLGAYGEPVVAIDSRTELRFISSVPPNIPVFHGDGTDPHVLERAGVASARAIVAVTDSDVVNLRVAHVARERNPHALTVVRVFSEKLAESLGPQTLGIDVALNPAMAAAATFVAHALCDGVLAGIALEDRLIILRHLSVTEIREAERQGVCELRNTLRVLPLLGRSRADGSVRVLAPDDEVSSDEDVVVMEEYRNGVRDVPRCLLAAAAAHAPSPE